MNGNSLKAIPCRLDVVAWQRSYLGRHRAASLAAAWLLGCQNPATIGSLLDRLFAGKAPESPAKARSGPNLL
jgi:hypothetical protein